MTNLKIWQVVLIVITIWLAIAVGTFSVYRLVPGINGPGVFGDSFGVVNSLFSGLAFALLFYSTWLQRKELESQRTELELQREELKLTRQEFAQQNETMKIQQVDNTFFNMLKIIEAQSEESSKEIDSFNEFLVQKKIDSSNKEMLKKARDRFPHAFNYCDIIIDCIRLVNNLPKRNQVFYLNLLSTFLLPVDRGAIGILVNMGYDRAKLLTEFHLDNSHIEK